MFVLCYGYIILYYNVCTNNLYCLYLIYVITMSSFVVGAGLAFTCGAYISTDLRGKDDPKNHVVGVLAASAVLGAAGRIHLHTIR